SFPEPRALYITYGTKRTAPEAGDRAMWHQSSHSVPLLFVGVCPFGVTREDLPQSIGGLQASATIARRLHGWPQYRAFSTAISHAGGSVTKPVMPASRPST